MTSYLSASVSSYHVSPLFQIRSAQMEVARYPLSIRAVDISLKQHPTLFQLDEEHFSDIWETRYVVERHFSEAGYRNRLCYTKFESETSPIWQVTAYSGLPSYLDNRVIRKIYTIWQQTKVLFRTIFPLSGRSETFLEKERFFWSSLDTKVHCADGQKNGRGALTNVEVIYKQIVFPKIFSSDDNEVLLLYNHAPLRAGRERMHFLLVPKPTKPAASFLELDKEQFIRVLSLAQKVAVWAEEQFQGQIVVHFFDKTGEIAGQTQPLFHAHLIIVKNGREEIWGRIAMFFRMFFPARPLPSDELGRRVKYYRNSLGEFLTQHI